MTGKTSAQSAKERAHALIDTLPDEAVAEVTAFIELKLSQLGESEEVATPRTRYKPTPLGGLLEGYDFTEEDIAEARREMWGSFAEDEPRKPRLRPTGMGGLERGAKVTAEDIAEVRRELWDRLGEDLP